jgi:hypothetical protein
MLPEIAPRNSNHIPDGTGKQQGFGDEQRINTTAWRAPDRDPALGACVDIAILS